jgi:hypothetical protein
MAEPEPVFSYEGDIAPQKGSYFSDIPRKGSGFTYSTATSQRYAADLLRPFQKANREAEEAELKKRSDELAYQRNRLLVEQAQKETQMQSELLAAEPALTARLEEINAMTDPVAQQKAVTDFAIRNPKALQSVPIKFTVDLINQGATDALNKQDSTNKASDASLYNQVTMYAGVDIKKAIEAAEKISNSHMQSQAAALIASTAEKSKLQSDNKKAAKDERNRAKQDAEEQDKLSRLRGIVYDLKVEEIRGEFGADGKPLLGYTPESLNKLRMVAEELGENPEEVASELENDPSGFSKKIFNKINTPFTSGGGAGRVGEVTGGMMPTTP